ncbi:MAG TPA: hypothetical protein VEG60_14490 [Candidatus Binatia bacterium]|nr:hypothetical protein [Candidatus Binatia bacterium]
MVTTRWTMAAASVMLAGILAQPAAAADPLGAHNPSHAPLVQAAASADQAKVATTKAALRDLWIGHVFWVRNVVVAGLAGDQSAQSVAEKQVVANAQAIAASIEPFYGAAAKEKLFALLTNHYGAIKAYLDSSIAKNGDKQAEATAKLISNAGEIAGFLSTANPHLAKDAVEGLLQAHGGHHIVQIQELQDKDYAREAQTWSDMSQHMYVISDAIADALAKQFPAKFHRAS